MRRRILKILLGLIASPLAAIWFISILLWTNVISILWTTVISICEEIGEVILCYAENWWEELFYKEEKNES